jgi:hypothetical protein
MMAIFAPLKPFGLCTRGFPDGSIGLSSCEAFRCLTTSLSLGLDCR